MIRSFFLGLACIVVAADVSPSQANEEIAGNMPFVCEHIARAFTGRLGPPPSDIDPAARLAKLGMLQKGYVDLDGDGAPERFIVRHDGGTMNLAYLEISGTRASGSSWPFGVPRGEREINELNNKRRFARRIGVLPFGTGWFFVFFSDYRAQYPDVVIGFEENAPVYVCDFARKITEISEVWHRSDGVETAVCDNVLQSQPLANSENGAPLSANDIRYLRGDPHRFDLQDENTLRSVGSYTIKTGTGLHLADLDNDGIAERIARVEYLNTAGPGCYGEYLYLLPGESEKAPNADMQNWLEKRHRPLGGAKDCSVQTNVRRTYDMTFLDVYHSPKTYAGPYRSLSAHNAKGLVLGCRSKFERSTVTKEIQNRTLGSRE